MPLVEISPDQLHQIADAMEDDAYNRPPGTGRQDLLIQVYKMRRHANWAKWSGEIVIKADIQGLNLDETAG